MSGEPVVFLGPTMKAEEARTYLKAHYLPPVGQGDVVRAVVDCRPAAIAIIDGVFSQKPAVRHKEILWAMALGVRVYGASSMGAIRAAELTQCGMIGHGLVYRWYRRTPFADDADVAVAMAPVELGAYPLGEAFIDVRLTLKKAERTGVITTDLRLLLEQAARSLHFTELTYDRLIARVGAPHLKTLNDRHFRSWLATEAVNQKKYDAIALLKLLSSTTQSQSSCSSFELTDAFAFDLQSSDLLSRVLKRNRQS